jgi:drug/metabolite transporter (DMT)-like permease
MLDFALSAWYCLNLFRLTAMIIYIKLLLMAIFWGGTFVAGRSLAQAVGPFAAAFFRFAVASVFLVVLLKRADGKLTWPAKDQIIPVILLGLTGALLYNYFFLKGLKLIEAGRASVIIANNPIFIALLSAYFFKERLNTLKIIGIIISVVGAVIVVSRGSILEAFQGGIGLGEIYIFGCVASWVAFSLIGKAVMKNLSPLQSVTYSSVVGTLLLSAPAFMESGVGFLSYSMGDWALIFYLGFFGTVLGFLWYYQGIQKIGPTRAGLFINFVPISGILLAFVFLGEQITPSLLIGTVMVSLGVYLTNRPADSICEPGDISR